MYEQFDRLGMLDLILGYELGEENGELSQNSEHIVLLKHLFETPYGEGINLGSVSYFKTRRLEAIKQDPKNHSFGLSYKFNEIDGSLLTNDGYISDIALYQIINDMTLSLGDDWTIEVDKNVSYHHGTYSSINDSSEARSHLVLDELNNLFSELGDTNPIICNRRLIIQNSNGFHIRIDLGYPSRVERQIVCQSDHPTEILSDNHIDLPLNKHDFVAVMFDKLPDTTFDGLGDPDGVVFFRHTSEIPYEGDNDIVRRVEGLSKVSTAFANAYNKNIILNGIQ